MTKSIFFNNDNIINLLFIFDILIYYFKKYIYIFF